MYKRQTTYNSNDIPSSFREKSQSTKCSIEIEKDLERIKQTLDSILKENIIDKIKFK